VPQINGVMCNTLTFYDKNFNVLEELNSLLLRHILTNDANSLLLFGSTGEGTLFSNRIEEKIKLINIALKTTEEKIPIIVRLYGDDAEDIISQVEALGKRFEKICFMITPPISINVSPNILESYFQNILGSINTKNHIYLYNNPLQFTRNEIDPELLKSLMSFNNLKGLTDSFYNIRSCRSYAQLINEDFSFFCGLEQNFHNFFQLIPLNQRKHTGIISSMSNIVNLCSKLYYYALEDNLLELLKLQEQINDIRSNIYNIKTNEENLKQGLKVAFLHLYKDSISKTNKDFEFLNSKLQTELDTISKERIEATVNYLLNHKQIYQLYSIGRKDLYQFHEIIKIFSKIDTLVQQGKVKKITGPYRADVNTIYKVKFENSKLVFRFRTSKFLQFENLIKEKLLYPFLDRTIRPMDLQLREKVKEIINTKTGAYIFKKENPPIIPVSNLVYFDETKKAVPFPFSVQEYIRGKPLFQLINSYINDAKNLETTKFLNLFTILGEHLGNLHKIKFDSFCKRITDIGKRDKVSYHDFFQNEIETELHEAKKYNHDLGNEVRRYFSDNQALIEDENEFVLLHNDFNSQNVIIKEDRGVIHLNGFVDFDNWCVGSRAQDFIKLDYLIFKSLNTSSLYEAFQKGYSRDFFFNREFIKKIEVYKLLWLLKEYNIEAELKRNSNKFQITSSTSTSLENYLFEIQAIIRDI
jgi:dihydrodipicolinate synthase/N-acetylneuraminate lyase/aminoglycoside phosphotransferase (APT) family kinase protein